ncbi:glycosyltransferase family 9 protein [Falsiroseomonas oryzae]|uniref:glycosyltransferase family 9 protein n=1 Tax=Falsiroseomonas oryzae TaxID=2766473 RepID=UPI0022EA2ABC|nr:glycosyltransferase family 9 protein [Roseomonas sp. MO-31]
MSILRELWWSVQPGPRAQARRRAILPALWRFVRNVASVLRQKRGGRPLVAIGLVGLMGDIIAVEPVVRLVRRRFPDARIVWVVCRPYEEVVRSFPEVDDCVVVTCLSDWLFLWATRLFDVALDLHVSGLRCPVLNVPVQKAGLAVPVDYDNYYEHGGLLTVACLGAGIPPLTESPRLSPPAGAVARVDSLRLPERFVAMHAMSNESSREWPAEKWRELVTLAERELGLPWLEVGGAPFVLGRDDERCLAGRLSILETAELLRRATLFIGIDSGPAHIAHAVGAPGVVLLGRHRHFTHYTPYSGSYADGSRATLVRTEGPVAELPVEEALAAVLARLRQG